MSTRIPALTLAALLLAAAASATEPAGLVDYADIMDALRDGAPVRVVADYGRCRLVLDGEEVTPPEAEGGMVIDAWEHFARGAIGNEQAYVVFSHAALIVHPRRGPVLNHVKFKVSEDDSIVISARYLDPRTYEETMFEEFTTAVARGTEGAVWFYRLD
jgi:hypothetical protein